MDVTVTRQYKDRNFDQRASLIYIGGSEGVTVHDALTSILGSGTYHISGAEHIQVLSILDSVEFDSAGILSTIILDDLTNGYIPYDDDGLKDSPIFTDGVDVSIYGTVLNPIQSVNSRNISAVEFTHLDGSVSTYSFGHVHTEYLLNSDTSVLRLDQTVSQTILNGQPIWDTLTASELIATDANKKLQSLAVATYPSLTEISYVKDVTSAIQTQLNAKVNTLDLASNTPSSSNFSYVAV